MGLWSVVLGVGGTMATAAPGAIAPAPPTPVPHQSAPIRPNITCPDTVDALLPMLLRDLPSYANRVLMRSQTPTLPSVPLSYVLLAGKPDLTPLPLGSAGSLPLTPDPTVQQLFFTTLERQYSVHQVTALQSYHWVFLTRTSQGWRLVLMFSRLGEVTPGSPPAPPQDTSQGAIAQALRLWLRDCEAGAISP